MPADYSARLLRGRTALPVMIAMNIMNIMIITTVMLSMVTSLPAAVTTSMAKKGGGPKVPRPEQAPAVIAAQQNLEEKTKLATEAKQRVAELRRSRSQAHEQNRLSSTRATRGEGKLQNQKTEEVMKAETNLKAAEETLAKLLDELHESYRNAKAMKLRRDIAEIQDDLDDEKRQTYPDGKKVALLTSRIRKLARDLEKIEKTLFSGSEEYKEAIRHITTTKRELFAAKARARQQTAGSRVSTATNASHSAVNDEIKSAVQTSAEAYKVQQQAKRELHETFKQATIRYEAWRLEQIKKEKEKQQNQNKNNRN